MLQGSWWTRILLAPEGDPAGAPAGGTTEEERKRSANASAVDQIHSHEERLQRIETPFFARLFAEAEKGKKPPASAAPPQVPAKRSVVDELADYCDPFDLFVEPAPPKAPEAPAADDA
jgi:hypothetical protein